MQTLSVQIQDSYIEDFMNYVNAHSDNITISKDKNLELDPYFYERQKELHQTRNDIKNGNIEMVSHETLWGNIKNHLKTIETK
jgi:DNA helicase IV